MRGAITFWTVIALGYAWSVVQLISGEPFDALVLFIVTYGFHVFRNAIKQELEKL